MMPKLLNEAFSAKAMRQKPWKHHKEPYDSLIVFDVWMTYVADFVLTDRQVDTLNTYRNHAEG